MASTIITKYSDYVINSIEYFIERIESCLEIRDVPGLFNNKIEIINITKQHPLAEFLSAMLSEQRNADDLMSSIIPAISVTPGNMSEEGFTLGKGFKTELVNDTFIDVLKTFLEKTQKERIEDVLLTQKQIELIIGEYNRLGSTKNMRAEIHEWHKDEEINVSVWTSSADMDIILGNLMDSILSEISVGFSGDEERVRHFRFKTNKGLTNFNFGRTLYGSEYNLTFLNTFNNYTIYTDDIMSSGELDGTFNIPGDE